jgi:hypothetical protein
MRKARTARSIGARLTMTLLFYGLLGLMALFFMGQPVFALALYLHGMMLAFCGMFVAGSSGEMLFNKEEADILLHRPIAPQTLLRAKLRVLVEVSLWLAGAFNIAGLFAGTRAQDGGWMFPLAHAISTVLESLFCTSCVVLGYELCLRTLGRQWLENVMTTVQIAVAIGAVLAGQIAPRMMTFVGPHVTLHTDVWWVGLIPPAWYAGFDDALAGSHAGRSWLLGGVGVALTGTVVFLAMGRLARHYELGLQMLGETSAAKPGRKARRRWLGALVEAPPLCWWLRDPIERASFFLTLSYLVRDRDVKLRVYPGLAPMLIMPAVMLMQEHQRNGFGGFGIASAGAYLGIVPMLAVSLLQYSQQWQAADVFRVAPIVGPARICAGVRQAVTFFLTLPLLAAFVVVAWLLRGNAASLWLLLPGMIALPVYTLIPHVGGRAVPLSVAGDEARSAGRGLSMILVMLISTVLGGAALWTWHVGWFRWFLAGEAIVVAAIYFPMRRSLLSTRWISDEP